MNIKQTTINGMPVLLVQLPESTTMCQMHTKTLLRYQSKSSVSDDLIFKLIKLPLPKEGYTWRFINLTKDVIPDLRFYLFDMSEDEFFDHLVNEFVEEWPKRSDYGYYEDYDAGGHLNNSGWETEDGEDEFQEAIAKCYAEAMNHLSTWGLIVGEKV